MSIGDSLAHVAGVPGIERSISVEEIQDPILMARYVAAQHPITPIGVPSYHATTYGWIASELLRRVDGRSIGAFVREEIAGPLHLDMHIGVPNSEMHRVGEITRSDNYNYSAMIGDDVDPRLQTPEKRMASQTPCVVVITMNSRQMLMTLHKPSP